MTDDELHLLRSIAREMLGDHVRVDAAHGRGLVGHEEVGVTLPAMHVRLSLTTRHGVARLADAFRVQLDRVVQPQFAALIRTPRSSGSASWDDVPMPPKQTLTLWSHLLAT